MLVSWAKRNVETALWSYQSIWPLNAEFLSPFHRIFSPPLGNSYMKVPSSACPGWCWLNSFSKSFIAKCPCSSEFLNCLMVSLRYWWKSHKDTRPIGIDPSPSLGLQPKGQSSFQKLKEMISSRKQSEQLLILQALNSQEVVTFPFLFHDCTSVPVHGLLCFTWWFTLNPVTWLGWCSTGWQVSFAVSSVCTTKGCSDSLLASGWLLWWET